MQLIFIALIAWSYVIANNSYSVIM